MEILKYYSGVFVFTHTYSHYSITQYFLIFFRRGLPPTPILPRLTLSVCLCLISEVWARTMMTNWHVGSLSDRQTFPFFRILIFGLGPFFGRRPPFSDLFICSKAKIIFKSEIWDLWLNTQHVKRSNLSSACFIARYRPVFIRPKARR